MLTRKQHELLSFIDGHLRRTGFSPSFEEMKDALQLRSKSGIHRLISALEERGFLQRRHHRARALEVVRLPDNLTPLAADEATEPKLASNVVKGEFGKAAPPPAVANEAGTVQLPLYGRIAAGQPIEAMQDANGRIDVPVGMLGGGEHYALIVTGDSMIEAGILDGDAVIIRKEETANNGEIVVALVDGNEVTLKRLRRRSSSIALEPANAAHETRIFPAERVRVQGKLVGLLRQYH